MQKNVEFLGQVFTNEKIVQKMNLLRENSGAVLEPSCGDGAFFNVLYKELEPSCGDGAFFNVLYKELENYNSSKNQSTDLFYMNNYPNNISTYKTQELVGIEYDNLVCPVHAYNMDFFDYSIEHKFDTIIGNPPYVKYRNIAEETKKKLEMENFDQHANLYLFFIEKCIKHLKKNGELIFIVPRDFIKASSSIKLNNFIFNQGTITHWIDLGDELVFPGFSPNCVIFRFEKDNFSRETVINNEKYRFETMNGQLIFTKNKYETSFQEIFYVKVGGASGLDSAFIHKDGNCDFVYSKTRETGKTRRMFYNTLCEQLEVHKDQLLKRKIRFFSEDNWYMWGRNYFASNLPRIYVNVKTRKSQPFFLHTSTCFDGSVLAIFPKKNVTQNELEEMCKELNDVDWKELGFVCNNRYLFTQKSLENTLLPEKFNKYIKKEL